MITCQCPHCNGELTIADAYAGRTGRCTLCGGTFQAPGREEPTPGGGAGHQRWLSAKTAIWAGLALGIGMLIAIPLGLQLPGRFSAQTKTRPPIENSRNQPSDWVFFPSKERTDGPGARLVLTRGWWRKMEVPVAADAVLISYLPDRTLGTYPSELALSLGDTNRVLLRFDLQDVRAAEVVRAVLTLDLRKSELPPSDPFEAAVYRVTGPWEEASAVWRNQPPFDPAPAATFTIDPAPGIVNIDITSLVHSWCGGAPNLGLLLKAPQPLGAPPVAAAAATPTPPQSANIERGIAVLASDIGSRYPVDALAEFILAGDFSPVVVDWAWITAHWDKTDFDAVNGLTALLARSGIQTWAMYRPRFLGSPSVAVQTTKDGESAFDHGEEIRYTDPQARQWGYSWGCEILKRCPGISEIIIYNPRNLDDAAEARAAIHTDPDAPLKAVAGFLAEARSAWRAIRPDIRLGLVSGSTPDAWRFVSDAIDAAHPFLLVKDDVDTEQSVREAVQLRDVLGARLAACLAKVTWGETDKVTPLKLAQLDERARAAGLSYFVWTFDTLFDSALYQPDEVAKALSLDFARLAVPLQGLHREQRTAAPEEHRTAPAATVKANGLVPAYAEHVDARWSSPPLPIPPEESDEAILPWPHESPGLSAPERDTLRQNVWVINNFPLYQCGDTNAYCHNGIDIVLENGMPVYAMKDGYVKSTKYETVIIADARGDEPSWAWAYTHLGNVRVSVGDFVKRGTPIGEIHFTGLPHLHLERIYSKAPQWGEWCYAVMPDRHFTYPDDDPPVIETPFHFFKNTTNDAFTPDAGGTVAVTGDVDIVVGMREQGLYAHSRQNGFGDRLAVARIQYAIKNVESGQLRQFASFDFSRLAIKESVNDTGFNTQVTNVLYKHPRLFEPERSNFDKTLTYYVITNCPDGEAPRELKPEFAQLAWRTAETASSGTPQFPDGAYDVTVTAWDFSNHSSRAETRITVHNGNGKASRT